MSYVNAILIGGGGGGRGGGAKSKANWKRNEPWVCQCIGQAPKAWPACWALLNTSLAFIILQLSCVGMLAEE